MPYCKSCGTQLQASQSFCPNCGKPVLQPAGQVDISSMKSSGRARPRLPENANLTAVLWIFMVVSVLSLIPTILSVVYRVTIGNVDSYSLNLLTEARSMLVGTSIIAIALILSAYLILSVAKSNAAFLILPIIIGLCGTAYDRWAWMGDIAFSTKLILTTTIAVDLVAVLCLTLTLLGILRSKVPTIIFVVLSIIIFLLLNLVGPILNFTITPSMIKIIYFSAQIPLFLFYFSMLFITLNFKKGMQVQ